MMLMRMMIMMMIMMIILILIMIIIKINMMMMMMMIMMIMMMMILIMTMMMLIMIMIMIVVVIMTIMMVVMMMIIIMMTLRKQIPTAKMDPAINETLSEGSEHVPQISTEFDVVFIYLSVVFKMVLNPVLGVAGICINVINMVVFYRMGLSDGVTQNFFILALSDGLFAMTAVANSMGYLFRVAVRKLVGYNNPLELAAQIIYQGTFYCSPFAQNVSLITTVVIAVVRYCSVAMPLQVKQILPAKRQLAAILFLSGIATSISVYVLAPMHIVYAPHPVRNYTMIFFNGQRWSVYTVFNKVLSFGGFIICIAFVVILSARLKKASKFRESSSTGTSDYANTDKSFSKHSKERQRTARIVRTVVLVSVIFIVCNVPNILYYLLRMFLNGFSLRGRYSNAMKFTLMVVEIFWLLSVCLNTVIYYFCNSRYRTIFRALF